MLRFRLSSRIAASALAVSALASGCRTTDAGGGASSEIASSPLAPAAPAGREYYMMLIGYERDVLQKFDVNAHTFGSFAAFDRDATTVTRVEEFTISWLPRDNGGKVSVVKLVPGKNWRFEETYNMAKTTGRSIHRWGPFHITKELYDLAVAQKARLDAGAAEGATHFDPVGVMRAQPGGTTTSPGTYYVAVDPDCRNGAVQNPPQGCTNCFHAVSDMLVPFIRTDFMVNGGKSGFEATDQTMEYFLQTPGKSFIMNYPRNLAEVALYSLESNQMAKAWSTSVPVGEISHNPIQLNAPAGYVPQFRVKPGDLGGDGWLTAGLSYEFQRRVLNQIAFVDPLQNRVKRHINGVKLVIPGGCPDAVSTVYGLTYPTTPGAPLQATPATSGKRDGSAAIFTFDGQEYDGIGVQPDWGGAFKGRCQGFEVFRQ